MADELGREFSDDPRDEGAASDTGASADAEKRRQAPRTLDRWRNAISDFLDGLSGEAGD
jgi:hypothetical protein